jgi:nucleotide-binding universal stress UspA family protein
VFERILVPLDGSEHSNRALECAVQIAKKFEGKITLLHVYSIAIPPMIMHEPSTPNPAGIPVPTSAEVSKIIEGLRDAGSKILSAAEEQSRSEGIETESILKEGNTPQEIVKAAKDGGFGLIIMGARGIHRIAELLMGNVTENVIKNSPCPVLIVK